MGRVIIRRIRRRVKASAANKTKKRQGANAPAVNSQKPEPFSYTMLGDLNLPSKEIEAMAVMFDLAGFTKFCNQVDQHLSIHVYLKDFLEWIFNKIAAGLSAGDKKKWAELPFLSKFHGDGVLFLWDTEGMTRPVVCRILTLLCEVTHAYKSEFLQQISGAVDKAPRVLRCGIARGRVFSVGDGKDYVGHCINVASRLQKVGPVTFCFAQRGFPATDYMPASYRDSFVLKRTAIRGVGEEELVWILKSEFNQLSAEQRDLFRNP